MKIYTVICLILFSVTFLEGCKKRQSIEASRMLERYECFLKQRCVPKIHNPKGFSICMNYVALQIEQIKAKSTKFRISDNQILWGHKELEKCLSKSIQSLFAYENKNCDSPELIKNKKLIVSAKFSRSVPKDQIKLLAKQSSVNDCFLSQYLNAKIIIAENAIIDVLKEPSSPSRLEVIYELESELEKYRELCSDKNLSYFESMFINKLLILFNIQKKYDVAQKYFDRAKNLLEDDIGPLSLLLSGLNYNISINYEEQKDYSKAKLLLIENLEIYKEFFRNDFSIVRKTEREIARLNILKEKEDRLKKIDELQQEINKMKGNTDSDEDIESKLQRLEKELSRPKEDKENSGEK